MTYDVVVYPYCLCCLYV